LFKVIELSAKYIRKITTLTAFLCLSSLVLAGHPRVAEVLLSPPGLRPIKDPFLVIPADFHYLNQPIKLPAYRDTSGNPAGGWSARFVDIRRFASDQSAWIFFRDSDLQRSETRQSEGEQRVLRFWPVGTILIIETYKGNALQKENDKLIEIAVMSKIDVNGNLASKAFYPASWAYAKFKPDGNSSISSGKVHECHQCHSIAFHLTGDLVFTLFR
jgi:hypothetical protein